MSLLTVLLIVAAMLVCAALIALLDSWLGPRLGYPRWFIHVAYGLIVLIVVLYLCRAFGVWALLSSVRV